MHKRLREAEESKEEHEQEITQFQILEEYAATVEGALNIDGRCKRGIRYPVALILTLIGLAKLMGEPKLSGVSQWVRLRGTWLNEVLHLQRTRWPAASTYTYVRAPG